MRRCTIISVFVGLICGAMLLTTILMSMQLRPLKRQVVYPPIPPTPAPTTVFTTTSTTTTSFNLTAAPTLAPTTAAPTFAPLAVVCPPDVNIILGSSLELQATGYAFASGGDIPACGAPVVYFSDQVAGIVARSPSFNASNLVAQNDTVIPALNISAVSSAASWMNPGVYILATETSGMQQYQDSYGNTFSFGNSQGSVYWDGDAFRFVIIENGANNVVYIHVNSTALGMGGWDTRVFNITGSNPQLGIWPQAYAIAVSAATNNMCVVDRLALLAGATYPDYFCATSILGPLAGFSASRQSWTPLGTSFVSNVTSEVESAGTSSVGAVFMRHHDDELHNGATTPLYDWIDIDHWTNINFTTHDFVSLRYTVSISDFDSSPFSISTPDPLVLLDSRRENIMPRLQFWNNRVVAVFASNSNNGISNVRWVELVWQSPTILLAARFVLKQQGTISSNSNRNNWLPTAAFDWYSGTIVVSYNGADNSTIWPSMYASSRLLNDPLNGMRNEILIYPGSAPLNDNIWASMSPLSPRNLLYSSGVTSSHVAKVLHLTGEIIARTFTGENQCNLTTCIQVITQE